MAVCVCVCEMFSLGVLGLFGPSLTWLDVATWALCVCGLVCLSTWLCVFIWLGVECGVA